MDSLQDIKVIQINLGRGRKACHHLRELASEWDIDIILVQEPPPKHTNIWGSATCFADEDTDSPKAWTVVGGNLKGTLLKQWTTTNIVTVRMNTKRGGVDNL